ncbi:MAG: plasmid mobilization protein [Oscillospiraceae bacterium]|jgi:hypothetical protein
MKKDIKFSTRMASEDREAIKELAKRSGMSMSDYVTACCLGKQVVVVDGLKEVLKELKSIGRNLNQLVTLAHMGRITVSVFIFHPLLLNDIYKGVHLSEAHAYTFQFRSSLSRRLTVFQTCCPACTLSEKKPPVLPSRDS